MMQRCLVVAGSAGAGCSSTGAATDIMVARGDLAIVRRQCKQQNVSATGYSYCEVEFTLLLVLVHET
jgi:hypothetical protein